MIFNKLVRDKIPKIIRNNHKVPVTKILNESEYRFELEKKLQEEVLEYLNSNGDINEIADIFEVLFAIVKDRGYNIDDVMKIKEDKCKKRGGFEKKIFLIEAD